MDKEVTVKVSRLTRRLSIEQPTDAQSPSTPSTPTKKRATRLAAKPQLDLIDENTPVITPKRVTRKSVSRDVAAPEEKQPLTPARRSTRIKSNTSIISETSQQTVDSPRARRLARRNSLVGEQITPENTNKDLGVVKEESDGKTTSPSAKPSPQIERKSPRIPKKKSPCSQDCQPMDIDESTPEDTLLLDSSHVANETRRKSSVSENQNHAKRKSSVSEKVTESTNQSKRKSSLMSPARAQSAVLNTSDVNTSNASTSKIDVNVNRVEIVNNSHILTNNESKIHLSLEFSETPLAQKNVQSVMQTSTPVFSPSKEGRKLRQDSFTYKESQVIESNNSLIQAKQISSPNLVNGEKQSEKLLNKEKTKNSLSVTNIESSSENNSEDKDKTEKSSNQAEILGFKKGQSKNKITKQNKNDDKSDSEEDESEEESHERSNLLNDEAEDAGADYQSGDSQDEEERQYEKENENLGVVKEESDGKTTSPSAKPSPQIERKSPRIPKKKSPCSQDCQPMDIDESTPEDTHLLDSSHVANETRTSSVSENQNHAKRKSSVSEKVTESTNQSKRKSSLMSPARAQSAVLNTSDVNTSNASTSKIDVNVNRVEIVNNSHILTNNESKIHLSLEFSETPLAQKNVQSVMQTSTPVFSPNNSLIQAKQISSPNLVNGEKQSEKVLNKEKTKNSLSVTNIESSSENNSDDEDKTEKSSNQAEILGFKKGQSKNKITKQNKNDDKSDSEEDESEDESHERSNLLNDEAEDAGADYQSGDSQDEEERQYEKENEILGNGETLTSSEEISDDSDYEKDSFLVSSDAEDEELLSGSGEDLSMSDNELTMSAKSKKKFDERKAKQQKQASQEMYEARHNVSNKSDTSDVPKPSKKKNRLRLESTMLESENESMTKTSKKTKRLSESNNENEITNVCDNSIVTKEDPLVIKVKPEPKTPQCKSFNISTVNLTYREEMEAVNVQENMSIVKTNETSDPLQNYSEDSDDESISENEEIKQVFDSLLARLNKEKITKKNKSLDLSLNLNKKGKQIKATQDEQKQKNGKPVVETEDSDSGLDIKLLFNEDSNDSEYKSNSAKGTSKTEDRIEASTNLFESTDVTDNAKETSFNTSIKRKNKRITSESKPDEDTSLQKDKNERVCFFIDTKGNASADETSQSTMPNKKNNKDISNVSVVKDLTEESSELNSSNKKKRKKNSESENAADRSIVLNSSKIVDGTSELNDSKKKKIKSNSESENTADTSKIMEEPSEFNISKKKKSKKNSESENAADRSIVLNSSKIIEGPSELNTSEMKKNKKNSELENTADASKNVQESEFNTSKKKKNKHKKTNESQHDADRSIVINKKEVESLDFFVDPKGSDDDAPEEVSAKKKKKNKNTSVSFVDEAVHNASSNNPKKVKKSIETAQALNTSTDTKSKKSLEKASVEKPLETHIVEKTAGNRKRKASGDAIINETPQEKDKNERVCFFIDTKGNASADETSQSTMPNKKNNKDISNVSVVKDLTEESSELNSSNKKKRKKNSESENAADRSIVLNSSKIVDGTSELNDSKKKKIKSNSESENTADTSKIMEEPSEFNISKKKKSKKNSESENAADRSIVLNSSKIIEGPSELNTSEMKKNKKNSELENTADASKNVQESEFNTSKKKKNKHKKTNESQHDADRSIVINKKEVESLDFFVDPKGSDDDAPEEVSAKKKKKNKNTSVSFVDEAVHNASSNNPKKVKKSIETAQALNTSTDTKSKKSLEKASVEKPLETHIVEKTAGNRKRKASGDAIINETPQGAEPIATQGSKKKRREESGNTEPLAPAAEPISTQGSKKKRREESGQGTNRSKKRKDRDEDEVKHSKIRKESYFSKVHVPRLPEHILNQIEDKPKVLATTLFTVEETTTSRRKNKPSNYLEETICLNEDSPKVKRQKKLLTKPKVLPFVPSVSISNSGCTTDFKISIIPKETKFVAQTATTANVKNNLLENRKKKLGTYELYKKHRQMKLSKF